MDKQFTFIWDLDGTLIDSYGIMVECLHRILWNRKVTYDKTEVYRYVKQYSIIQFMEQVCTEHNISSDDLAEEYFSYMKDADKKLSLIPNAKEIIRFLAEQGVQNYIYTHKGISTHEVLDRLGMKEYFNEIVTAHNGFKRKPDPEALNYLIHKYGLDKETTYYVGDRSMDVDCASNAGIKSIFLGSESFTEVQFQSFPNYVIYDLMEIKEIINFC